MAPVAALVGVTTLLFPVPRTRDDPDRAGALRLGRVSPRLAPFFRLVRSVSRGDGRGLPAGMLVSLVKLSHLATVILGTAFWAMATLIVVLTFAARAFDSRLVAKPVAGDPPGDAPSLTARQAGCPQLPRLRSVVHACRRPTGLVRCPRCRAPLHMRKPASLATTWALTPCRRDPLTSRPTCCR